MKYLPFEYHPTSWLLLSPSLSSVVSLLPPSPCVLSLPSSSGCQQLNVPSQTLWGCHLFFRKLSPLSMKYLPFEYHPTSWLLLSPSLSSVVSLLPPSPCVLSLPSSSGCQQLNVPSQTLWGCHLFFRKLSPLSMKYLPFEYHPTSWLLPSPSLSSVVSLLPPSPCVLSLPSSSGCQQLNVPSQTLWGCHLTFLFDIVGPIL